MLSTYRPNTITSVHWSPLAARRARRRSSQVRARRLRAGRPRRPGNRPMTFLECRQRTCRRTPTLPVDLQFFMHGPGVRVRGGCTTLSDSHESTKPLVRSARRSRSARDSSTHCAAPLRKTHRNRPRAPLPYLTITHIHAGRSASV